MFWRKLHCCGLTFCGCGKAIEANLHFLWKKTRRWKVLAGWAAPRFVAHTTHLLHFGMDFPLTKEARVSTDPHNWHTKSGKNKTRQPSAFFFKIGSDFFCFKTWTFLVFLLLKWIDTVAVVNKTTYRIGLCVMYLEANQF